MQAGYYCIEFEFSGGTPVTDVVLLGVDVTSPSHSGNSSYKLGSTWNAQSYDSCFYVHGNVLQNIQGIATIQGISQITF